MVTDSETVTMESLWNMEETTIALSKCEATYERLLAAYSSLIKVTLALFVLISGCVC